MSLLIVHESEEARRKSENLFRQVLAEAGLRTWDVDQRICGDTLPTATCTVALGTHVAASLIPNWSGTAFDKRGYIFEGYQHRKVLVTVDLMSVLKTWVPWRVLLSYDLQRAKEESNVVGFQRPERNVSIVTSENEARSYSQELKECDRVACDIEIYGDQRLACVGFAYDSRRAVVYPACYLNEIRGVLEAEHVRKIFQNGQFDLYFLATRYGIRIGGYADDTILAWHACYPELAGVSFKGDGKRKTKMTRKSLAFLASLFTKDAWWKDYEFKNEEEMYILNGRDCCITYEVMLALEDEIQRLGVRDIYEHELGLVWPVVDMQARGLRIDDAERRVRIERLNARQLARAAELRELALPLIQERIDRVSKPHLFRRTRVCRNCRGGSKKRLTCTACGGAGKFEEWDFNPSSPEQVKALLYEVCGLPKKIRDGKLTSDEEALKQLLAACNA